MTTDAIDKMLKLVEHNRFYQKDHAGWKEAQVLAKTIKLEIVEIEDFVQERLEERIRLMGDIEFYKTLTNQALEKRNQSHKDLRVLEQKFAELWKENASLSAENNRLKQQSTRYEKLRKLNVSEFRELYLKNLSGEDSFDVLVDKL
jgi:phage shock protein A